MSLSQTVKAEANGDKGDPGGCRVGAKLMRTRMRNGIHGYSPTLRIEEFGYVVRRAGLKFDCLTGFSS